MNKTVILIVLIYWLIMSAVAVYITKADKKYAKQNKRRVPEKTLMLIGLFGGAEAMLITMKNIRHKTKHNKFMIGLPCEIALHAIVIIASVLKMTGII